MLLDSFNLDKFGTCAPKFPRLVSLVSTRISSMWTSSKLSIPVSALYQRQSYTNIFSLPLSAHSKVVDRYSYNNNCYRHNYLQKMYQQSCRVSYMTQSICHGQYSSYSWRKMEAAAWDRELDVDNSWVAKAPLAAMKHKSSKSSHSVISLSLIE